ncbi:MAG: phage exclusion protein Lit family protein [Panacagrimonas sp.]
MHSPLRHFIPVIAKSVERIAPELADSLPSAAGPLELRFKQAPEFVCEASLAHREILITTGALELLWCGAFASIVLQREYEKSVASGQTHFHCASSRNARNAINLFRWCLEKTINKKVSNWPAGMPLPITNPKKRTDGHLANEIFLCAIAWIFHHEIARIRFQHSATALRSRKRFKKTTPTARPRVGSCQRHSARSSGRSEPAGSLWRS